MAGRGPGTWRTAGIRSTRKAKAYPQYRADGTGLASWSQKDIVYALETGFAPEGDALGGLDGEGPERYGETDARG